MLFLTLYLSKNPKNKMFYGFHKNTKQQKSSKNIKVTYVTWFSEKWNEMLPPVFGAMGMLLVNWCLNLV